MFDKQTFKELLDGKELFFQADVDLRPFRRCLGFQVWCSGPVQGRTGQWAWQGTAGQGLA